MLHTNRWRMLLPIALIGGAALAHHSIAAYDNGKTITINGVVRQFQWANPHSYAQILVPDDKGGTVEWSIEVGVPNIMARTGWTKNTLKPGDKVTIQIHPIKSGARGGSLSSITLADGKVIDANALGAGAAGVPGAADSPGGPPGAPPPGGPPTGPPP